MYLGKKGDSPVILNRYLVGLSIDNPPKALVTLSAVSGSTPMIARYHPPSRYRNFVQLEGTVWLRPSTQMIEGGGLDHEALQ